MDTRRRTLVLAGSAWLAGGLAACGGGGETAAPAPAPPPPTGGGNGGGPVALAAPEFAGPPTALDPLVSVSLQVAAADPGSSYSLRADLGGGLVLDLPADAGQPDRFSFTAPVGVLDNQGQWTSGQVALTLTRRLGTDASQTVLSLPVTMAASGVPGTATATLLRATQLMAQQSLSQLGLLGSKMPSGLDLAAAASTANQLNARYAEFEALVRRAMAGQAAVLELGGGVQLPLTAALLAQLDAHALAVTGSWVVPASGRRRHALADDLLEDDARSLAQQMAESARRIGKALSDTVGLAAGVVAAGALLAGSTPVALAAGGVAATAWMVGTFFGTAVGAALDGGSAALLDGEASWQDYAPTGKFFGGQYLSLAKDALVGIAAKLPLGGKLEEAINIAWDASEAYESVTELSVLPAFNNGTLNKAGYPDSDFTLSVQATASPYVVTVRAVGGGASARVRLQISGTDGYVFNTDAVLAGGSTEFRPSPASPGSGIVDTINVFDLDGRASASATVTF